MKKSRKPSVGKIIGVTAGVVVISVGIAYIAVALHFKDHFLPHTVVNGVDVSGMTVEEAEDYYTTKVTDYTLTLIEKDNQKEEIKAEDIDMQYVTNDIFDSVKEEQSFLNWLPSYFGKNESELKLDVVYNKQKLYALIDTLNCVAGEHTDPVNAYPKFENDKYIIVPEVEGTAVDADVLKEKAASAIDEMKDELNLEEEECYKKAQYTSESEEVVKACDEMNSYLGAKITYTMNEDVTIDSSMISQWISFDPTTFQVTFNQELVAQWLEQFANTYDTVGATRTITTPWGKTSNVDGGTYGWGIDEETEYNNLVNDILSGNVVTREPAYYDGQTAAVHGAQDWGTTYAEVDLTEQHMWYIVNGQVAMESDVVTGVPTEEKETTPGVWSILEMQLNKTLVGDYYPGTTTPEYETPVAYWMRITWSGIGFHDATWQPAFGGNLYESGYGSHGCVNMPLDAAAELYSMIYEGCPVIIHY